MGWSLHHPHGLIYHAPQYCHRGYTLFADSGRLAGGSSSGRSDSTRWSSPDDTAKYCNLNRILGAS